MRVAISLHEKYGVAISPREKYGVAIFPHCYSSCEIREAISPHDKYGVAISLHEKYGLAKQVGKAKQAGYCKTERRHEVLHTCTIILSAHFQAHRHLCTDLLWL